MPEDYELLYLAKENNEHATDILLKKYYHKIWFKAKKACSKSRDIDDYLNEGLLCFYESITSYVDNSKFSTYLSKMLTNRLINYKVLQERKKYSILNEAFLIDNYEEIPAKNLKDSNLDPELIIEENENYQILKNRIISSLNPNEEIILNLIEQNFTIKEISNIMDIKNQKVYNIINKIRLKVSKIM